MTKQPPNGRPPSRGGRSEGIGRGRGYNPGERRGKGTKHGGKGKSMGGGQTRPPEKTCRAQLIAVPWVIVKLLFGWRPEGYQVANVVRTW